MKSRYDLRMYILHNDKKRQQLHLSLPTDEGSDGLRNQVIQSILTKGRIFQKYFITNKFVYISPYIFYTSIYGVSRIVVNKIITRSIHRLLQMFIRISPHKLHYNPIDLVLCKEVVVVQIAEAQLAYSDSRRGAEPDKQCTYYKIIKVLKRKYTKVTIRKYYERQDSLLSFQIKIQMTYYVETNCFHCVKIDSHNNKVTPA